MAKAGCHLDRGKQSFCLAGVVLGLLVLGSPAAMAQLAGAYTPADAQYAASVTDNTQTPSVAQYLNTDTVPGSLSLPYLSASTYVNQGDQVVTASITGPNAGGAAVLTSTDPSLPLYRVSASQTYSFIVQGPLPPAPVQYVTLDLTASVQTSGTGGNYYAAAALGFDDSPYGPMGPVFTSCVANAPQTCPGGGGLGGGVQIGGGGSPSYTLLSGSLNSTGEIQFQVPDNANKAITLSVMLFTYDDASTATATVDPIISIDPSTPNYQNYTVVVSSNTSVPEPVSCVLFGTAIAALALRNRRRL